MPDIENELRIFNSLKGNRGTWEAHWEEIAEVLLPRQIGFTGSRTKGEKKTQKVFDAKPMMALERFGSVMDSMLTPRQQKWHNLRATLPELNRMYEVQNWFYEVNQRLYTKRYEPRANFAGQNSERWVSMGAFGTGTLFIDWDGGIRYRCVNLKDTYLLENHQGVVDTVYRTFTYTARQAVQRWGRDAMPDRILKALDNPNQSQAEFEFLHVVKPSEDYEPGRLDYRGKPFVSLYIAVQDKQLVAKPGGYGTFPYSISRYITAPDEVYGRGPAMTALPDIKMLNEMAKSDIRAVHKLLDPPILLADDGVLGGGGMTIDLRPNALIPGGVDRNGRQMVQPFSTGSRVDINEDKMNYRRGAIDDAFLVTLFQILVETPRMTATEALIRAQEKGMLLTPTMGRQHETLGLQIERELDILFQHGQMPQMPEVMLEAQGEYEVVYENPLARMQRAEELVGVQRTMELLAPFAQMDPSILDVFDQDKLAQLTAEVSGVPTPVIRSAEDVAAIRQQRQQQQDLQNMVASAQPVAGALKDVAQAQQIARGG